MFALKKLALATVLALSAFGAQAVVSMPTPCTGEVTLGAINSGIADRDTGAGCINAAIQDEPNRWGNHGEFVRHVSNVTLALLKNKTISARERSLIMKAAARSDVGNTLNIKLLAINDFHGNLEPPAGGSGRIGSINAGGAEYLATHIATLKAANPMNVVLSAGDLVGASPLLSALFHDEPTIEAMNLIGLNLNAVGNHEFDQGAAELLRKQNGGCHPVDGCQDGDGFTGAEFKFLAANVVNEVTGKTLFPAYQIRNFKGNKVAFIGMTLKATPSIVSPAGVAGLKFLDEADTVNALVPELRARGVHAIVVMVHEGGVATGGYNECPGISGPIVNIVNRLDDAVDAVVSGHTHQPYNCALKNKAGRDILVTSAASYGRLVSDIELTLNTRTRDVASAQASNVIVTRDVAKAQPVTDLIGKYNVIAKPLAERVIGSIAATLSKTQNAAGESSLGDVIADAQLFVTRAAGFGEAVVGFMNPGGIRADLVYAASGTEGDGNVTYGEAFTVQPFGNSLVTMSLNGAQIKDLLEQQFTGCTNSQPFNRILQVSNGFEYTWDAAGAACNKVDPNSIKIGGVSVNPAGSYRITVNSFLAEGGDNFQVLKDGTDRLGGAQDLDALETYLNAHSPTTPGPQNRITRKN